MDILTRKHRKTSDQGKKTKEIMKTLKNLLGELCGVSNANFIKE